MSSGSAQPAVVIGLVRCSTDMQDHSVQDQETEIRSFALGMGAVVRRIFRDEAVSGSELDRPGVLELVKHLETTPEKGTLVIWHRDRLARPDDLREGIILEYQIEKLGWKIRYLHGATPTGNILVDVLQGAIEHHQSGEDLRKLSRNTLRGQLHRVLAGEVPGCKTPYGYMKIIVDAHGSVIRRLLRTEPHRKLKHDRARWEPGDQSEITVVRRIFASYLDGCGFSRIAASLNDDKIAGPESGPWTGGTIRDLLLNRSYVGDLVWNKETTAKFHRLIDKTPTKTNTAHPSRKTGKRVIYAANNSADWITVKDHHAPLIERSIFERVGELMRAKGKRPGTGRDDYSYPLSAGLAVCLACGSNMTGFSRTVDTHRYRSYTCSGYFRARGCKPYSVPAEKLQRVVAQRLRDTYAVPALACPDFRDRIVAILRRRLGSTTPTLDSAKLTTEKARLERKIQTAIGNLGEVGPEVAKRLAEEIRAWERRQTEIDHEIVREAGRKTHDLDLEQTADEIVGTIRRLNEGITGADPAAQKQFFRSFVDRVELKFATEAPTNGRRNNRHTFVEGEVQANALLVEASRAFVTSNDSLGGKRRLITIYRDSS